LAKEIHEYAKKQSVFNRLATPEEIAEVVGFLAGEKSRWVTGQNFIASGGATITQ
jgi:3-oxoacyl-[acyl-carrier protein] reductase